MARSKVEQVRPSPRGEAKISRRQSIPANNKRVRQGFRFWEAPAARVFAVSAVFVGAAAHPPQGTKLSPKKAQATAMHLVI